MMSAWSSSLNNLCARDGDRGYSSKYPQNGIDPTSLPISSLISIRAGAPELNPLDSSILIFCLRFVRCVLDDENSLRFTSPFDTCLRDEALEKYDAVGRDTRN